MRDCGLITLDSCERFVKDGGGGSSDASPASNSGAEDRSPPTEDGEPRQIQPSSRNSNSHNNDNKNRLGGVRWRMIEQKCFVKK